jgi:hypothetical protein
MYINTLPNAVENASILLFADDAKVYKGVRNQADQRDLQEDINRMLEWTEKSLLQFNADKCKYLPVHHRQDSEAR